MNYTTLAIGVFALLFGVCILIVRIKTPEKFSKLNAMKEKFGDKQGLIIHSVAYTIIPIVIGTVFIYAGVLGVSLF